MKIDFSFMVKDVHSVNDNRVDDKNYAHQQKHNDGHAKELSLNSSHGYRLLFGANNTFNFVQTSLQINTDISKIIRIAIS